VNYLKIGSSRNDGMERRPERLKACTFTHSLIHSFMTLSVLPQVHSLFRNNLSRVCGLCYLFPIPISYILQGSDDMTFESSMMCQISLYIFVLFYVLFVLCRSVYYLCKCVLYYCHRVATRLQ